MPETPYAVYKHKHFRKEPYDVGGALSHCLTTQAVHFTHAWRPPGPPLWEG